MKLRTVTAVFSGNSKAKYSYFVPEGDEPKCGDVILTSINWRPGQDEEPSFLTTNSFLSVVALEAKLARVVGLDEVASPRAAKFYLKLVSLSGLRESKKRNDELLEAIKKKRVVSAKLQEMLEEQSLKDRYANLAERNPEAARLLAELEEE